MCYTGWTICDCISETSIALILLVNIAFCCYLMYFHVKAKQIKSGFYFEQSRCACFFQSIKAMFTHTKLRIFSLLLVDNTMMCVYYFLTLDAPAVNFQFKFID